MALRMTKDIGSGLVLPGLYARIDTISGFKGGIDLSLNFYVSRDHFLKGNSFTLQEMHHFKPDVGRGSENFIRQGYLYLKTLPDYEAAEDIWEDGQP